MQNMPSLGQMAGEQQPQAQSKIDVTQGKIPEQKQAEQMSMIVAKITAALESQGYYDLPENQGREEEINAEIQKIAQAIIDGNDEVLQSSEIYKFITQKAGQTQAMTGTPESGEMPSMEGM